MKKSDLSPVALPSTYPTAMFFIDESGSRASAHGFFVMGGIKVRQPGHMTRAVRTVRDRNTFNKEFKFSQLTQGSLCAFYDLIDTLADSDARICATVVDNGKQQRDRREPW